MSTKTMTEAEARAAWIARAREMTLAELPTFLAEMAEHPHDYGTICIAIAAAALGAAHAMNRSERGGITGFQASFVAWEFLGAWHRWPEDSAGHRLVDFDDLLYPQYAERFRSIPRATFDRVRTKALALLRSNVSAVDTVRRHWDRLAKGEVPFGLRIES
jgi:hypothetical protein